MTGQIPRMQPLTLARAHALAADLNRRRVLDQIAQAMNRDEVDAAWDAQRAWLSENPDDFGMLDAGERLANVEEWLESGMADDADNVAEMDLPARVDRPRGETSP